MPALSNRCMTFNESLHSKQLSINSEVQGSNTGRRNSTWDTRIHHTPLITMEELSDLNEDTKGIIIIGKQINDDRPASLPIHNTQNTTRNRFPRLHVNNCTRRKWSQNNAKITINNRMIKSQSSHIKEDL